MVVQDRQLTSLTDIQARIYLVRGVQVMLDRDLAVFYKVDTGQLNRQVKRNIGRFPEDFMFQLTKEEWKALKCQIGISNVRGGDRRALPYVFTEQGVSQLSGVLHNDLAEKISISIMRAFVAMRRFLTSNAGLFQRVGALEQKQIETEKKLDVVLDKIEELSPAVSTEELFGTGCVWDAYTFISGLVRSAEKRVVLIDNFVDERTLLWLDKREPGVECIVHTRYTKQSELDFEKHNQQYEPISYVQLPHAVHDL
ncbi:MAG: ORF6N domain-containing protein [Bacteroidaceae bacterium]|nr:ORF6N domain-containing protein [Bacteroidaceae bacterium]